MPIKEKSGSDVVKVPSTRPIELYKPINFFNNFSYIEGKETIEVITNSATNIAFKLINAILGGVENIR